MATIREISLTNGQSLKDVIFDGTQEEFITSCRMAFEIILKKTTAATTDKIHLLPETMTYFIFDE